MEYPRHCRMTDGRACRTDVASTDSSNFCLQNFFRSCTVNFIDQDNFTVDLVCSPSRGPLQKILLIFASPRFEAALMA